MRLLSCNIENFGKLHELHLEFQDGLNIFCYENGWGKSTLVTFLRVMFYGFEGERKKSGNERNNYKPWQGGVYGGTVRFEEKGKRYELTRTFGKKESEDTFELRNFETNLECNDFSTEIGKEILGVDGESFMRTLYIGQGDCKTSVTGDMNAKIGNLSHVSDDINNFDVAYENIKKYINKNSDDRKSGTLYKLNAEIASLDVKISKESYLEKEMLDLRSKLNEQKEKLRKLKEEQKKISKKREITSKYKEGIMEKKNYDEILRRYQEAEGNYNEIRALFLEKMPNREEIEENLRICSEMEREEGLLDSYELTEYEKSKLDHYKEQFSEYLPTTEEILRLGEKVQKFHHRQVQGAVYGMSEIDKTQLNQYRNQYGDCQEFSKKVYEFSSMWDERIRRKDLLPRKQYDLKNLLELQWKKGVEKKRGGNLGVVVLGFLFFIVGIIVTFQWLYMGILVGIMGLLSVCFGLFFKRNKSQENSYVEERIQQLEEEIKEDQDYIKNVDFCIQQFMEEKGKHYESNLIKRYLGELMRDASRYEDLERKENDENLYRLEHGNEELEREIIGGFSKYGILCDASEFSKGILDLKSAQEEYQTLIQKKENRKNGVEKYNKKKEQVAQYLLNLGVKPEHNLIAQLHEMEYNLHQFDTVQSLYFSEKEKKEEFEKKHDVLQYSKLISEDEIGDLVELDQLYQGVSEEEEKGFEKYREYQEQFKENALKMDEVHEAMEQRKVLMKEYEENKKRYELIKLTGELLNEAKERFTTKYIGPLEKNYTKYYEIFSGKETHNFNIDANAEVTVKEYGTKREISSLSEGLKDLVGLCMRLAFIDSMYEGEKPTIIFDDSFVNLDEEHLEGGKRLLKALQKDYQIIYLTCHKSRVL